MIKKLVWLISCFCILPLNSIVIVTIPKSGTHLVEKALIGITGYKRVKKEDDPLLFKVPQESLARYLAETCSYEFYSSHLNYLPENTGANYLFLPADINLAIIQDYLILSRVS